MDNHDLPSDSDESDVDYVPGGADSDAPSEEESGPEDSELQDDAGSGDEKSKTKGKKRKSQSKRPRSKKIMKKETADECPEGTNGESISEEKKKLTEEEEKKKADSLYADFMKDVGGPPKRKVESPVTKTETQSPKPETKKTATPVTEKENKVTITQVFEFAGEEVRVTKAVAADSAEARLFGTASTPEVKKPGPAKPEGQPAVRPPPRRGGLGGIGAVLSQIGKKAKISTLEKSKLDWEGFKKEEGIEDEIQTHNRGKDGYLEKQDFLQRADVRQFEIEKQLRATRRGTR